MGRSDAPNLREVPEHKSCHSCDYYDENFSWCDKYDFDLGFDIPSERVCDDWSCV